MAATLDVREADPQGADATALLREAAMEARALYPEFHAPNAPEPTNPPNLPRGIYLVASLDGQPVGMAAHRPLDDSTTEIRRVFVQATARRAGVARALLHRLEEHARSVGFTALVLETGDRQRPAIALYLQCGFRQIDPFGPYQDDPTSVCFGKSIQVHAPGTA